MKYAIVTRVVDTKLHLMSREFYPPDIKYHIFKDYSVIDYLLRIFKFEDYDFIISLNDTSYIWDFKIIEGIINYMDLNGYHYCGLPDGGMVRHRAHNPVITNPCFNIFDLRKIRNIPINPNARYVPGFLDSFTMKLVPGYKYSLDNFEKYYYIYYSLLLGNCNCLYLRCNEFEDKVSTIIHNHQSIQFMINAWYPEHFNSSSHHSRILKSFEYAKGRLK